MWMRTVSGKQFFPDQPTVDLIDIEDIAHALSNICRFAGHVSSFYSVAQHSVIVAGIVKDLGGTRHDQIWGLLHDATEAYLTDIPTPVKILLKDFGPLEDKLHLCISKKFGLSEEMPEIVKRADVIALATEARDLMGDPKDWGLKEKADPSITVVPLMPFDAKDLFLKAIVEYNVQRSEYGDNLRV